MKADSRLVLSCDCGNVEIEVAGAPIVTAVCYCRDCQEGSKLIEARPGAPAVREADGGTAYVLFRRDRVACAKGDAFQERIKLRDTSITNRVVASCCNSALLVNFDKGPFWISVYRKRFGRNAPNIEFGINRAAADASVTSDGTPRYAGVPFRLVRKLVGAWIAMTFGR